MIERNPESNVMNLLNNLNIKTVELSDLVHSSSQWIESVNEKYAKEMNVAQKMASEFQDKFGRRQAEVNYLEDGLNAEGLELTRMKQLVECKLKIIDTLLILKGDDKKVMDGLNVFFKGALIQKLSSELL